MVWNILHCWQGSTFYRRSWLQINGVTIQWHAIRFIRIVMTQCTVQKVTTAKGYVKPERLPSTTSAVKFHCRRTYLQVMQWMSKKWRLEFNWMGVGMCKGVNWSHSWWTWIPYLINCWKWSTAIALQDVFTRKCSCRRNGLECTTACGHFSENMAHEPVIEDEERWVE